MSPDVSSWVYRSPMVFPARTSSLREEKRGGRNLSWALLKHLTAQHDFFGADTRLGVYRALSSHHYVKLNKHKSPGESAESETPHTSTVIEPSEENSQNKQIDCFNNSPYLVRELKL